MLCRLDKIVVECKEDLRGFTRVVAGGRPLCILCQEVIDQCFVKVLGELVEQLLREEEHRPLILKRHLVSDESKLGNLPGYCPFVTHPTVLVICIEEI